MTFLDWIQIASIILVTATLSLNLLQLREIATQSRALGESLQQIAYSGMSDLPSDPRFILFADDPELLAWHLTSRGFNATSPAENKRRLYTMAKLVQHETCFMNHSHGHLDEESWCAWENVLRADLRIPEFQEIWHASKEVYAASFASLVSSILVEYESPTPDR